MTDAEKSLKQYETRLKLMCNGLVRIMQEDKGVTTDELSEYANEIGNVSNMYVYYKKEAEETKEEEDAQ